MDETPKTPGTSETRDELRGRLAAFATEQVSDAYPDLDVMPVDELVAAMCESNETVPGIVSASAEQITAAIEGVVDRMRSGGRLIYIGAGTAGRVGVLDASEIPPTFGTDPSRVVGVIAGGTAAIQTAIENVEDDADRGRSQLQELGLSAVDAVVGISASGRTPFVVAALEYAAELGAFTVGFACNASSAVGAVADVAIETVVGPEFVTGSTRLKAGTAQKLVVNLISTITMIRLGKVYRTFMVDLRATNEKLRARSERTVMLATGTDAAEAARALAAVDGWVKAAILVVLTGLAGDEAIRLLNEHGGMLREAIASAPPAT